VGPPSRIRFTSWRITASSFPVVSTLVKLETEKSPPARSVSKAEPTP